MAADTNILCYGMHAGEIIYLLTLHLLFNCKHHKFLLFKFICGEGI